MKIGIIGGIGSGKSTASEILKELGFNVVSCDQIYKELSEEPNYISIIEKHFPDCVINNKIDRKILGNIVFNDKNKLEELNNIAHPLVKNKLNQLINTLEGDTYIEVPVFIGSGLENFFDKIILITAEIRIRIDRIVARSGYTRAYAQEIIKAQPQEGALEKYADIIVLNNKDKEYLKQQLIKLL